MALDLCVTIWVETWWKQTAYFETLSLVVPSCGPLQGSSCLDSHWSPGPSASIRLAKFQQSLAKKGLKRVFSQVLRKCCGHENTNMMIQYEWTSLEFSFPVPFANLGTWGGFKATLTWLIFCLDIPLWWLQTSGLLEMTPCAYTLLMVLANGSLALAALHPPPASAPQRFNRRSDASQPKASFAQALSIRTHPAGQRNGMRQNNMNN